LCVAVRECLYAYKSWGYAGMMPQQAEEKSVRNAV